MENTTVVYYQIEAEEESEEKQSDHEILMAQLEKLNKKSEQVLGKIESQKEKRLAGHA